MTMIVGPLFLRKQVRKNDGRNDHLVLLPRKKVLLKEVAHLVGDFIWLEIFHFISSDVVVAATAFL